MIMLKIDLSPQGNEIFFIFVTDEYLYFNLNSFIMKKILLTVALILGFSIAASAQPRAIGAKFGWGLDLSYQHSFGTNFLEANLGLNNFNAIDAVGIYNFMIAQPYWTDRGEWGFYAGPGAALGTGVKADNKYFHIAAAGMVGLEYTFWFPLQVSFDLRTQIGADFGHGLYGTLTPSLGVRYRF
jgi:hypothetical protein